MSEAVHALDASNDAQSGGAIAGDEPHSSRVHTLRRAATLTALLGAGHAILFLIALWLLIDVPTSKDSDASILAYYTSPDRRISALVGLFIMPFAGIAFIWFTVSLRMWERNMVRREDVLLSNIQLVTGVLYVALFFVAAAAIATAAASIQFADDGFDPVSARQFPQFGHTLLFVFAIRMAAMFVLTTSNMGHAAGILPRWFTIIGFAAGLVLMLSASFNSALAVIFPVWMLLLSIVILWKIRKLPPEVALQPSDEVLSTGLSPITVDADHRPGL